MKIKATTNSNHGHAKVQGRCPQCGKDVVFEHLGQSDVGIGEHVCGQRKCPDPECSGHIFVVLQHNQLLTAYPSITIDFDSSNIPESIKTTFDEALVCHSSQCHVASAIMVRRTLEEICEHKKATGKDLKKRLKDLESKIVLPQELITAMDELRLLGNDAAHIEAKDFNDISNTELEVAIDVTKEIMKGLYQYSTLLGKLRALKKTP